MAAFKLLLIFLSSVITYFSIVSRAQQSSNFVEISTTHCSEPISYGECEFNVPRYAFDSSVGTCVLFDYSGCGGNTNNFVNHTHCLDACLRKKIDANDETNFASVVPQNISDSDDGKQFEERFVRSPTRKTHLSTTELTTTSNSQLTIRQDEVEETVMNVSDKNVTQLDRAATYHEVGHIDAAKERETTNATRNSHAKTDTMFLSKNTKTTDNDSFFIWPYYTGIVVENSLDPITIVPPLILDRKVCEIDVQADEEPLFRFELNRTVNELLIIPTERLDCETRQAYHFNLSLTDCSSDGKQSNSASFFIVVSDVNDHAPIFDQNYYEFEIDSNTNFSYQFKAFDSDCRPLYASICEYSIVTSGNPDKRAKEVFRFSILQANLGILSSRGENVIFEEDPYYKFQVEVKDCGNKSSNVWVTIREISEDSFGYFYVIVSVVSVLTGVTVSFLLYRYYRAKKLAIVFNGWQDFYKLFYQNY